MKNVPLRFRGHALHHNPETLRIECAGHIRELNSPCRTPKSEYLGNRLRRVIGEGELYGADCIEQFRALEKLCADGEEGLLSLPKMPSMHAYLRELRMIAEAKEDVLSYRFEFIESQPAAQDVSGGGYYETVVANESLWNIAYRYRTTVEDLVRLNPQIAHIGALDARERVRLC